VSQTPAVSGKQLVKVLERQGWYVKRVRGSHHINAIRASLTRSLSPSTAASRSSGALGNILRTAGISRENFDRLL